MSGENEFLLHALLMGIYITFVYDNLRILRRVLPHNVFFVSMEDLLFWFYCAVKVFLMMYRESNGTMRWFAIMGAVVGMLLYLKLVSPVYVQYMSLLLQTLFKFLAKLLRFFLRFTVRPVVRLAGTMRERILRAKRRRAVKLQKKRELNRGILKKKLTFLKKVLKIGL